MSKKKEPKECILVNIMYSGDYLNEKHSSSKNIGGEWINLVKPDDSSLPHYLFITQHGRVDHDKYRVGTVLFARAVSRERGNNRVEVIAMATGCKPVEEKERKSIGKTKYAGVPLSQISKNNTYKGKSSPNDFFATFTAKSVIRVKEGQSIFLYSTRTRENGLVATVVDYQRPSRGKLEIELNKCPNNQSLRTYIDAASNGIQKLLKDRNLWGKKVSILKPAKHGVLIPLSSCFVNLLGQLHDELSYSNLIAYFLLRYEKLRTCFLEWLARKAKQPTTFTKRIVSIQREENHVDLLIRVDGGKQKYMIVIENKIRSNINGKKKEGQDQLDIYAQEAFDKCTCGTLEEVDALKKKRTSKKQNPGTGIAKEPQVCELTSKGKTKTTPNEDKGRIPWFFLLTPKYNCFEESDLLKKVIVVRGGKEEELDVRYTQIYYGDLYNLFSSKENELGPKTKEEKIQFKEFLTALKAHDRTTDNINEEMMNERVLAAIARITKKG